MAKPEGFRSYVVKLTLYDPTSNQVSVRAALLAVMATGAETAIQSVRQTVTFENPEEWRVEYVREGVIQ